MASATASNVIQGQSLKSHFMPIWVLALLISSIDFFKELQYLHKIIQQSHQTDQGIADLKNYQSSVSIGLTLKLAKNVILEIDLGLRLRL